MDKDAASTPEEKAIIKDLQKKMLNGQKEEVIKYLQSLPQAQADKIRWKLVKSLERISQRAAKKQAAPPPPVRSAGKKDEPKQMKKTQLIMDRYQLGEAIGKGGFATVYRALDTERGDFVAIKQIEKRLLAAEQLPKIMHEADLLKKLTHPNVVGFRGSVETSKHIHFVLEFVEGGSLYRVVKKFGTFTEKLCAIYLKQVLAGLDYLHESGIVHRDIVSLMGGNLLLSKDGIVKLADFGACTYTALNKSLTVVGTPFWMAPEIIEMSDGAGTPADIWSLGCTVLELLTGSPPYFHLGTMQALFKMVEDSHPPIPKEFSPELHDFLLQCFNKDFRKRPTAKILMVHKWIAKNATQTKIKKDELEGKLKAVNRGGAPAAADSSTSSATKAQLNEVKGELKSMRLEQQKLQVEILKAKKEKTQLEIEINKLKLRNGA